MKTKATILDVIFTVVFSVLWVSLGIVWVLSLNPAGAFFLSALFCAFCIFILPVVVIAVTLGADYINEIKNK